MSGFQKFLRAHDRLALLVSGLIGAAFAWAFGHFLGKGGVDMVLGIALLVVAGDNIRLRRQLRERR